MTVLICTILNMIAQFLDTSIPAFDFEAATYETIRDSVDAVVNFVLSANFIVPLKDISIIIGIDLAVRLWKFSLFIGNWVVRRVCDIIP